MRKNRHVPFSPAYEALVASLTNNSSVTVHIHHPPPPPPRTLRSIQLKAGFPPKDVTGSGTDQVVKLGIPSGSALTVVERKPSTPTVAPAAGQPLPPTTTPPTAASPLPPRARTVPLSAASSNSSAFPSPPRLPPPSAGPQEREGRVPHALQALVDMGFSEAYAARALEAAGGDINTALEMCVGGGTAAFGGQEEAGELGW